MTVAEPVEVTVNLRPPVREWRRNTLFAKYLKLAFKL